MTMIMILMVHLSAKMTILELGNRLGSVSPKITYQVNPVKTNVCCTRVCLLVLRLFAPLRLPSPSSSFLIGCDFGILETFLYGSVSNMASLCQAFKRVGANFALFRDTLMRLSRLHGSSPYSNTLGNLVKTCSNTLSFYRG